ncbi:hypothetical protein A147_19455 [Vibrio splendidus FF-6]|nr:hypothetical protein A147_19455 [Vibrio splendidus FF-6]
MPLRNNAIDSASQTRVSVILVLIDQPTVLSQTFINRWDINFTPLLEYRVSRRKKPVPGSWRMDETYIKVKYKWVYYYRAVDKFGNVIDYYLSLP